MNPLSKDVPPEVQKIDFEALRRMPGWEKIKMVFDLIQAERQLLMDDLRHRFPQASEEELRYRFISRLLPRQDVINAYGFNPEKEGYEQ